jgi:hypothetical protein
MSEGAAASALLGVGSTPPALASTIPSSDDDTALLAEPEALNADEEDEEELTEEGGAASAMAAAVDATLLAAAALDAPLTSVLKFAPAAIEDPELRRRVCVAEGGAETSDPAATVLLLVAVPPTGPMLAPLPPLVPASLLRLMAQTDKWDAESAHVHLRRC